jgi:beta-ribofuranosylaminobenzene 5'-phosphate synthase
MARVRTGSRLHFGVFALSAAEGGPGYWPNSEGEPVLPARWFGGAGLMVESPGLELHAEPAASWSAQGPLADRALSFAQQFAATLPECPPHRITVERAPPEHVGLGTGTQLGMAVAKALAGSCGGGGMSAAELAWRVGRGRRSALGVYGFERGGFLVEAGKRGGEALAPLVAQAELPPEWRVVLIVPPWGRGLHGEHEIEALNLLQTDPDALQRTDALCRLVLLGMLPALAEKDFEGFGEAVYDFNRRVGEAFRPVQGGLYSNPRTENVVAHLRSKGVRGVGQSSWGPAVFAFTDDEEHAVSLAAEVRQRFDLGREEVLTTPAMRDATGS